MIRFKMYDNYIQYVDGMTDCERAKLDRYKQVDGWNYHLCSVHCPQLYMSFRHSHMELYLPGYGTDKDYLRLYYGKSDKAAIIKLFDVFKDMLQLEGADRWIL